MLKLVLGQRHFMTNEQTKQPLILEPVYKDYLWGGLKINTHFDRQVPIEPLAESWEVSDRSEGHTMFRGESPFSGMSLRELYLSQPHYFAPFHIQQFPLLTKIIDAEKNLSIQVHPNETTAACFSGEPKSEMWYVIDADQDSYVYLGLKENLSRIEIEQAIAENALGEAMHAVSVKKGDCFYIPAGLFHAIGKGCLIYEVQQNSNTTYRLYDWGRKDKNGKARELHVEAALQVRLENQIYLNLAKSQIVEETQNICKIQRLSCPYFTFSELNLAGSYPLVAKSLFSLYFVLEGSLRVQSEQQSYEMSKGTSFLIPASLDGVVFDPLLENVVLLETCPNISPSQE